MMKLLLSNILLLPILSFAQTGPVAETLDWQKVRLEKKIQELTKEDLSHFLKKNEYIVNANITYSIPKKKTPQKPTNSEPEKISETDELIYLERLGLWTLNETATTEKDDLSPPSIFSYIKKVSLQILIDKNLSENKKEIVKSIADRQLSDFGKKSKVDIKEVDLKGGAPTHTWTLYDWIEKFSIPLGLIPSVIIFMILSFALSSRNQSIERKKVEIMETQAQAEISALQAQAPVAVDTSSSFEESGSTTTSTPTVERWKSQDYSGIQQFQKLIQSDSESAVLLIRQWLHTESEDATNCLAVLAKSDFVDEIIPLLESLDLEERKQWRNQLNRPTSLSVVQRVDDFLSQSVLESILVPPPPVKKEASELLAGISSEECAHVAKSDPSLGAVLANVMKSIQVAKMFSLLDEEIVREVSSSSVKFDAQNLDPAFDKILNEIENYRKESTVLTSPFIEKSVDLVRELGPSKETFILDAIVNSGDEKTLRGVTTKYFPAELIMELPLELLKASLSQLPTATRAELIFTQEDENKNKLLSAIGESGKARELIDLEVDEISSDELRSKKVGNQKEKIWTQYVRINRQLILSNESFKEQASPVLEKWLESKVTKEAPHAAKAS